MSDHALTYGKYAVIGALVGVLAIIIREAFAAILPGDTPAYYVLSVLSAYAVGIALSYYGHRKFTFGGRQLAAGSIRRFSRFTAIAVLGLVATTLFSVGIRYGLSTDRLLGPYGASFAFALATFLASVLTYTLNSWYTFSSKYGRGTPREAAGRGR